MNTTRRIADPVQLSLSFLERVWGPSHDLDAIDELMTEDYTITTGGISITGRNEFKEWVRNFQQKLTDAITESQETIRNESGDRVISRWICTGKNNGIFGLPADGREVAFTGIAIWSVRDNRLAACWVERSALELYQKIKHEGS
ncbi:nuclear transport factor 2 family protein [uncultured Imperialibacter sp.]|uniref:ester cyclase n=1 Tax=uncultured Imperialibacter sp. TaxID=1672639 RepID=UPI0030D8804B|tara:strand:+ start:41075 stop:41506 length:432 start_codon:yes stop_codon:yes gene_type:complete